MSVAAYAAYRGASPKLPLPRNMKAAQEAKEQGVPLVVSFVGITHIANPHVFCDSGQRYDWVFLKGLEAIVAVDPSVNTRDALAAMLERVDVIRGSYPTLVDVQLEEVASVVHSLSHDQPPTLWRVRRGTSIWQQYFPGRP